ncbi:MAG: hypothetical protein E6J70_09960 [Deltaproteobacteria bacterium]|nr:MAG: hypothetical protein E6J70_09960 [Deltaproteobacteria bacterium]
MARLLRRGLVVVATLIGFLALALWGASRFGVVQEMIRTRVLALLRASVEAQVDLGGVGGTLGRSLVLRDLRVAVAGHTVARVPRVEIVYAPLALLRGRILVRRLTLVAPRVRLVRTQGVWRLPQLAGGASSPMALEVRTLQVRDGRVAVAELDAPAPRRLAAAALELTAAAAIGPRGYDLAIRDLHFTPRGAAVTAVRASGRVVAEAGGAIRVQDLRLATARTRLDADGQLLPVRGVRGRLALVLDAGEFRALVPASPLVTNVVATADASGPWRAVDLRLETDLGTAGSVRGHVRADLGTQPIVYETGAEFARLDPGAAVAGLVRAQANGRARVRGRGLGLEAPLAYRLVLGRSEVGGRPLAHAALGGRVARGVHRARGRVVAPAGEGRLRARVVTGAIPAYRLAARLRLDHLEEIAPRAPGWVAAEARVAGRGLDARTRRAEAHATLLGASLHGVVLRGGVLHARLDGEQLRLETASLQGPEGSASATGILDLGRPALDVTLDAAADLRALGERLGLPLAGSASATGAARGPFTGLAVTARTELENPAYGAFGAGRARAALELGDLGSAGPHGRLRLELTDARVHAYRRRTVAAAVDWQCAATADRASLTVSAAGDEGAADRLAATLTRAGSTATVAIQELAATPPGGPPWRLVRPATVSVSDDAVKTDGIALAAAAQRVTLGGKLGRTGESDASLEVAGLELAPFCTLAGGRSCGGTLSLQARLAGTAVAPRLGATVRADSLRVDDVALGSLTLDTRYEQRQATLHGLLRHPEAGELRAEGTVPIDLAWGGARRDTSGEPLAIRVHADGLDLRFARALAPAHIREAGGRLALDARLSGTRVATRVEGGATLADGHLVLAATGATYEEVRVEVAAAGDAIELGALHARGGDGTLDAAGRIGLAGGDAAALDLRAHLHDFVAVRRPELEAALSGTIGVGGSVGAPDVRADLQVERAVVRPASLPAQDSAVNPDPSIVFVGGPEPHETPPETPSFVRALRLAAAVRIQRNAWVRRADADVELGGDLKITQAPGEPLHITGAIRLLRGWYVFQGRRLTLEEEGTITFRGATPPNPAFDVTAVFKNPNYRVTVHLGGTSEKPELTLASDPPLEQADILSVIVFGKPARDLGKGESVALQEQALQLASGYVMPELRASVMNTLGLDTLDVEMPQTTGTATDRRGRVSVGRYVAGDVFVSLAQEFGAHAGQAVGVEYGLTPEISVKGSTSTRGDSAIDIFWHRRY